MTIKELYEWALKDNLENEQMFILVQVDCEYYCEWDTHIIDDAETIDNRVYLNHSYYE